MPRVKKYTDNMPTEEIIDCEMELFDEERHREVSPAEVETLVPETKNGIVINSLYVRIRREPSLESDVIKLVRKGDKVKILDRLDRFYKISIENDQLGYVASEYIKEV